MGTANLLVGTWPLIHLFTESLIGTVTNMFCRICAYNHFSLGLIQSKSELNCPKITEN